MTDPLRDDELADARKLVEAATEGPWRWQQERGHGAECFLRGPRDWAPIGTLTGAGFPTCDFIAASRTLVPKLLDEIGRLRAWAVECENKIESLYQAVERREDYAAVARAKWAEMQLAARDLTADEREALRYLRGFVTPHAPNDLDTRSRAVLDRLLGSEPTVTDERKP